MLSPKPGSSSAAGFRRVENAENRIALCGGSAALCWLLVQIAVRKRDSRAKRKDKMVVQEKR